MLSICVCAYPVKFSENIFHPKRANQSANLMHFVPFSAKFQVLAALPMSLLQNT